MQLNPRIWVLGLAFGLLLAGCTVKFVDTMGNFGHTFGPWFAGLLVLLAILSMTFFSLSLLGRKMVQKDE